MSISFKKWLSLDEITMGPTGVRIDKPAQMAQDTFKAAQNWMSNPANADMQARLAAKATNRSALAPQVMQAATQAVNGTNVKNVTAPAVAGVIQNQLGIPQVIKPVDPTGGRFMRKQMRKH